MILDHRDDPDEVDKLADTVDDDGEPGEWLDGLRQTGLPVPTSPPATPPSSGLQHLIAESWAPAEASAGVRHLVARSIAPSTREAYENDWLEFAAWCHAHGVGDPLDATDVTVAEYVLAQVNQRLAVATIRRRLAAIAFAVQLIGRDSPTHSPLVRRAMVGASRVLTTAQRRAAPLRLDDMRHLVRALPIVRPDHHSMRRDQLLIALGWAGALRASELVALDAEDIVFVGDPDHGDGGALLRIRRSKTDQAGNVEWVAVPYATSYAGCPVRLALHWTRRHRSGPLFRHIDRHTRPHDRLTPDSVSRLLKPLIVETLQQDPAGYSSHSLRAGFVTDARAHNVPDELIARHTRHARPGHRRGGILHVYDRPSDLFERPALDPEWW